MSSDGSAFGGRKVDICGLLVDVLSFANALDRIDRAVAANRARRLGRPLTVFSANVDMIVKASRNSVFAGELNEAGLLLADGMPLLWMAHALGCPLPERIPGSDLVPRLASRAVAHAYTLFLFGSAPGVATRAAERLAAENPGVKIAGTLSPPMGFEKDSAELARIREILLAASPDVVLVGLGAPKQERWILSECARVPAAAFIAVGGTFDLLADDKLRAPTVVQKMGLEWAWRLAQEPARLSRRYLVEDPAIVALFIRQLLRRRHAG